MLRSLLFLLAAGCTTDVGIVTPPEDDDDGDGFTVSQDCDDLDPDTYPGAEEIPDDGIDQDCDGLDPLTQYGHRDDSESTTLVAGFLIGNAVELPHELWLTDLGVSVRTGSGRLKLALYASDGGRPAELVAETEPFPGLNGTHEIPVIEPVLLAPGAWWMQVISEQDVDIAAGPDELVMYRALPWAEALPDPYGMASDYEGPRISLFILGELP